MSQKTPPGLRFGEQVPFAVHKIGGRHEDGTPISLGPWTFETPQVCEVVEAYLDGKVLNACAGKTQLNHEPVHRNDLDPERAADTHHDVAGIHQRLTDTFDVIVFDPPFDPDQAEEHYNGHKVGRGPSGGIWKARRSLAHLTDIGGRVLSIGWNSVGLQAQNEFEREAIHLFQRVQKPDVVMTVDKKVQRRLDEAVTTRA